MILVALSGKKQSGKGTAADALKKLFETSKGYSVQIISFADPLRQMIVDYFCKPLGINITVDDLKQESVKESKHPCGMTYRQLLEQLGTDRMRSLWDDIWIMNTMFKCKNPDYDVTIIDDMRFPNEVKAVVEDGGTTIRLTRKSTNDSDHISNTILDDYTSWDCVVPNQGCTKEQLEDQIRALFNALFL